MTLRFSGDEKRRWLGGFRAFGYKDLTTEDTEDTEAFFVTHLL